jgi:hypothetical protein
MFALVMALDIYSFTTETVLWQMRQTSLPLLSIKKYSLVQYSLKTLPSSQTFSFFDAVF